MISDVRIQIFLFLESSNQRPETRIIEGYNQSRKTQKSNATKLINQKKMQHFLNLSVNISMDRETQSQQFQQVITKILEGDVNAFSILVEKYKKLVAHIVFRMIYNDSDREDLCQDIFLKIYQNLSKFRGESKLSTWIGKIAYNSCLNYINRQKSKIVHTSQEWDEVPTENPDPAWLLEQDDQLKRIRAEIEHLPVKFRTILTLYHLENMNYKDISEVMNLPEGTVKSYLFRARQSLKEKLYHKYQTQDL